MREPLTLKVITPEELVFRPCAGPWPHKGREFEIFVVVVPDPEGAEGDLEVVLVNCHALAPEVDAVVRDITGFRMTDDLFAGDLPDAVGLWKLKIKFVSELQTHWSDSDGEENFEFSILSKEKL